MLAGASNADRFVDGWHAGYGRQDPDWTTGGSGWCGRQGSNRRPSGPKPNVSCCREHVRPEIYVAGAASQAQKSPLDIDGQNRKINSPLRKSLCRRGRAIVAEDKARDRVPSCDSARERNAVFRLQGPAAARMDFLNGLLRAGVQQRKIPKPPRKRRCSLGERSAALFEAAQRVIPGGVNSPARAFGPVGGQPLFVTRGCGSKVFDAGPAGIYRLRLLVGPIDSRPRATGRRRGNQESLRTWNEFRRAHGNRGCNGRAGHRTRAWRGYGTHGKLGHGSHDVRGTSGQGVYGKGEGDQVRRLLARARGQLPDSGRGRRR